MRTLEQITRGQTEESRRKAIGEAAAALAQPGESVWQAIMGRFELAIAEANDLATSPDPHMSTEEKLAYSARERGLRDLWQELDDLRSGAWKSWPEFEKAPKRKKAEEQEEED